MAIRKDYNLDKNYAHIQKAIEEVKINTSDSVTLGLATLKLKHTEIPRSSQQLNEEHEQHRAQKTKEVAEKLLKLKNQSLNDLDKLLSEPHKKS